MKIEWIHRDSDVYKRRAFSSQCLIWFQLFTSMLPSRRNPRLFEIETGTGISAFHQPMKHFWGLQICCGASSSYALPMLYGGLIGAFRWLPGHPRRSGHSGRSTAHIAVRCGSFISTVTRGSFPISASMRKRFKPFRHLTISLLLRFTSVRRGSWFRWSQFSTISSTSRGIHWSIANGSLKGYWRLRNRPESLHQQVSWRSCVRSIASTGNIWLS
jgi:hypothetical protein